MRFLRRINVKVVLLRWWYSWRLRKYLNGVRIITDWLGDGAMPCPQKQAEARADVCASCPNNLPSLTFKIQLADSLRFIAEQMNVKNRLRLRVSKEQSLGTCKVCLCHLPLKVWLPTEELLRYTSEQELKEFPEHCWLVKEKLAQNELKSHI